MNPTSNNGNDSSSSESDSGKEEIPEDEDDKDGQLDDNIHTSRTIHAQRAYMVSLSPNFLFLMPSWLIYLHENYSIFQDGKDCLHNDLFCEELTSQWK